MPWPWSRPASSVSAGSCFPSSGSNLLDHLNLGLPTAFLAGITIVTASIIALTKDDLKARLAYSTVSQLSYIVLGVALLTPSGIAGGLIHIANHAFSKITLFMGAGAIYVALHTKKISDLSGAGRIMPFTMAAFGIASLSMIGVPLVCGFVTKWYLLLGRSGGQGPLHSYFPPGQHHSQRRIFRPYSL